MSNLLNKSYYNIAGNLVWSNSIARACFIFLLCMLMKSANKSLEKRNFPSGWKCYKTIGSYVICAFIEIWSTWEVWRALKKLEQLRIFRALQTSRVLHISMNARWSMNQVLNVNHLRIKGGNLGLLLNG